MKCCPICNGPGKERSRESIIKNGKLIDRVIMECNNPSHGPGAFIRYDDVTTYDKKEERRKLEISRQAYAENEIKQAIEESDGNVAKLARKLHISDTVMWRYLTKYPYLKQLVQERRIVANIEHNKTIRKRLQKRNPQTSVTPLIDNLVAKLDRVAQEQRKKRRQERMRNRIASFNHE